METYRRKIFSRHSGIPGIKEYPRKPIRQRRSIALVVQVDRHIPELRPNAAQVISCVPWVGELGQ